MKKIIFYTNEWSDVKEFIRAVPFLEGNDTEVAFSTDNSQLVELMSVGKLLVVTQKSYYSDVTVYKTNKPLFYNGSLMSWDSLLEVIKSE